MPYCMYLRKSRKDSENPSFTDEEILSRHQQLLEETAERQGLRITAIYREIVSGDSIAGRPVMPAAAPGSERRTVGRRPGGGDRASGPR